MGNATKVAWALVCSTALACGGQGDPAPALDVQACRGGGGVQETGWPEPRAYGATVYDPIHGRVILLAGQDAAGAVVPSVWAFDVVRRTWEKVADWGPPSIDLAAFDVAAGKVIVYHGFDWGTFAPRHATWALDPETGEWEDRNPAERPPEGLCGCGSQMVYDWRARRTVMFGGVKVPEYLDCLSGLCDEAGWAGIETNDVWTYDYFANRWTRLPAPAVAPAARNSHGLSYDLASGKVLLFGGDDCLHSFGDTWAYDLRRNRWQELAPAEAPSPRSYPKLTYDWLAGRTVAFGGEAILEAEPLGNTVERLLPAETWTYDARANVWLLEAPARSPSARAWNDVAYSFHGDRVVMFGGGADRAEPTDETWLYATRRDRWIEVPRPE